MYIITWTARGDKSFGDYCENHKAMTCGKDAAFALFLSLTKDVKTIEAKIRDDSGNLVSGGFFVQA
jgi:hypothetical protein